MDESKSNQKKPLRSTSNKIKDLYNTYVRNEGSRVVPINEKRKPKSKKEEKNNKMIEQEVMDNFEAEKKEYETRIEQLEAENELLKYDIQEIEKKIEEYKEQALRKAAELENIRRRSMREKQDLIEFANEGLLRKMLELMDDINSAIEAGKKTEDAKSLLTGVEMIQQKARKLFEENGVKKMEISVGDEFDVEFHEAMMHIPSEIDEGHIVQVLQPGYMMHDRVLRHARVITSAGKQQEN